MEKLQLVFESAKGQNVTTSLLVAQKFNKRHDNVLRDIETLSCSTEFRALNFEETPYVHPQNGRTYKSYQMTKDGFSFLVMGYTGELAGKFKEDFIAEFNRREAMLLEPDYILARAMGILQQRTQLLEAKVSEMQPKVEYHDKVLQSETLISTTDIAKQLGMSARTLNQELHKRGVQYYSSGRWMLYAKYQDKNFTGTKTEVINTSTGPVTKTHTYWTEKGRQFLIRFMTQPVLADGSIFTNHAVA